MFSRAVLNKTFNPGRMTAILIIHLLALGAVFTFSRPGLAAFLLLTAVTGCLGITAGFHRLLAHRSFETGKPLRRLLALLGCLALQGGPVRWVATHRLHHRAADTPLDPHSSEEGFWWSHIVWNFFKQPELQTTDTLKRYAPEIYNDPVLRFMDRHFFAMNVCFVAMLFLGGLFCGGWNLGLSLFFWGGILRIVYVWHITWLVNSATHYWGYRTFPSGDQSRNNWWVALLTFGEGWHNNHHAHPRSARVGMAWFEMDVTYWVIRSLRRLGLASRIVDTRMKPVP